MDRFLAGVERRALRMAELAVGNRDDALDLVQDAMIGLVKQYARRPEGEWGALFHRILQSRIRDFYRRSRVRNHLFAWLGRAGEDDGDGDPIADIADPVEARPETTLAGREAIAALETALKTLPLRQQQAFLLRSWEGLERRADGVRDGLRRGQRQDTLFARTEAVARTVGGSLAMTDEREQRFVEQVRKHLDAQTGELDELTLARLRAARLRALDTAPKRRLVWLPVAATATLAALVLAVMLRPAAPDLQSPLEDFDIVAAQEPLDLIDDYEFYEWLDASESNS